MQENNTENNKSSKKNEEEKASFKDFFRAHKSEFKKITWPSKKVLTKQTITVIFISLIVGVIIYGYDLGIDFILQKLVNL